MTLSHAATKLRTNFTFESALPWTSARARSSEFELKTRSTRLAVQVTLPVAK
jgi:hypothetical protein